MYKFIITCYLQAMAIYMQSISNSFKVTINVHYLTTQSVRLDSQVLIQCPMNMQCNISHNNDMYKIAISNIHLQKYIRKRHISSKSDHDIEYVKLIFNVYLY